MKLNFFPPGLLLTILLFSCRNINEESYTDSFEIEIPETTDEFDNSISAIEREAIIRKLQGTWKETEYPYGVVKFKDTLVKFIEEGVVEAPRFLEFRISDECPFVVNNIVNLRSDDLILVLVDPGTCEKLQVSKEILSLSGFNAHAGKDYRRVYKKLE